MSETKRLGFYSVSFRNAIINDVIGTITIPNEKGTHYTYEVIPREYINSHAGLTRFDLVRDDNVKKYTNLETLPDGTQYHTGVIEVDNCQVSANWDEDTNEFCLTIYIR